MVGTGVLVRVAAAVGTVVGTDVGGVVPLTNSIQLKLPPPLSMYRRKICCPALRLTPVLETVVQVCQPAVLGTVCVPFTFTPSISKWKVAPACAEATRTLMV